MQVSPVKRTTIFCKNIDTSLSLYKDILGFKIEEDKIVSGKEIGKMIGLSECEMHICHLSSENSSSGIIGLYEITSKNVPELSKPKVGQIHYGQVAIVLNTDEPDILYSKLVKSGYNFLTHPTKYEKAQDSDFMRAGIYTEMIFYDPDNVLVSILGYQKLSKDQS